MAKTLTPIGVRCRILIRHDWYIPWSNRNNRLIWLWWVGIKLRPTISTGMRPCTTNNYANYWNTIRYRTHLFLGIMMMLFMSHHQQHLGMTVMVWTLKWYSIPRCDTNWWIISVIVPRPNHIYHCPKPVPIISMVYPIMYWMYSTALLVVATTKLTIREWLYCKFCCWIVVGVVSMKKLYTISWHGTNNNGYQGRPCRLDQVHHMWMRLRFNIYQLNNFDMWHLPLWITLPVVVVVVIHNPYVTVWMVKMGLHHCSTIRVTKYNFY